MRLPNGGLFYARQRVTTEGKAMEPEYFCTITCETTLTHLFREDINYEVFLIDGDYFVTDQESNQKEVFKSDYNENVWLTTDGKSARFIECNAR